MTDIIALIVALTALVGLAPAILAGVAALRWSKAQQKELERHQAELLTCRQEHATASARLAKLEKTVNGGFPPSGHAPTLPL